jgi:hypothetical protein
VQESLDTLPSLFFGRREGMGERAFDAKEREYSEISRGIWLFCDTHGGGEKCGTFFAGCVFGLYFLLLLSCFFARMGGAFTGHLEMMTLLRVLCVCIERTD